MWKRKIMQAMAHDLSWDGECYDVHVEAYSAIKNMWNGPDIHPSSMYIYTCKHF